MVGWSYGYVYAPRKAEMSQLGVSADLRIKLLTVTFLLLHATPIRRR